MSTVDIMLDLETLGLKPGCKIIAIGACTFGISSLHLEERKTFYTPITINPQHLLTSDQKTLEWWGTQSLEAVNEVFNNPKTINLIDALASFSGYIYSLTKNNTNTIRIWGNSASFDLKILEAAYEAYNIPVPWSYRDEMCYRTLKNLMPASTREFQGTRHNALHDAIYQAECAEDMFNKYLQGRGA